MSTLCHKKIILRHNKYNRPTLFLVAYFIISGVIVFLVIESITTSSSLYSKGQLLYQLEKTKEALIDDNQRLKHRILNGSSLSTMEKEAFKRGFSKPTRYIIIKLDQ